MLVVDANVLLYAVDDTSPHHETAHGWLDRSLNEREPVAFSWIVLLAFLRISTQAGVFERPLSAREATSLVEAWLGAPPALPLAPGERHLAQMAGLLGSSGTAGNLVNDAHLAALALEYGATVVSFDRDFARFDGLRVRVPS